MWWLIMAEKVQAGTDSHFQREMMKLPSYFLTPDTRVLNALTENDMQHYDSGANGFTPEN